MIKRIWYVALAVASMGCEAPHHSIESILQRQTTAIRKLPAEDRARLMTPDEPVRAAEEDPPLGPGVLPRARARQIALRANPDIHAARARLEAALARIAEARSFYFPQIDISHTSNRTFQTPDRLARFSNLLPAEATSSQLPPNPSLQDLFNTVTDRLLRRSPRFSTANQNSFSDHTTALSGVWILFDTFVREARLLSSKHAYRASAMSLADVERLLVRAVDTAYFQTQLGREQVRIARADEQFGREQLADAQRRFEAKKITKADVLNFEVRVRAAQADLVAAAGLRDTGRILLAELLAVSNAALPDDVELAPLAEETEEDMTPPDVEEWLERARRSRPDLAEAQHILNARAENIIIAKGQFGPEVNMRGSWGYENLSNLKYSDDDQSSFIGVDLRMALTTGGFRTAQLRRARAEWWEAAAALRRKRLEIASDVRRAAVDLVNAIEQVELQRANIESAAENRQIVQRQYAAGKASLVRLNQAQRDLVRTDAELARARIRLRLTWSELRAAAGTYPKAGLEHTDDPDLWFEDLSTEQQDER